jgi:hypothetical protein
MDAAAEHPELPQRRRQSPINADRTAAITGSLLSLLSNLPFRRFGGVLRSEPFTPYARPG